MCVCVLWVGGGCCLDKWVWKYLNFEKISGKDFVMISNIIGGSI